MVGLDVLSQEVGEMWPRRLKWWEIFKAWLRWFRHFMLKQLWYLLAESSLKQAEKGVIHNRIACNGCQVLIVACFYIWSLLPGVSLLVSPFSLHCELGWILGVSNFIQAKPTKKLGICVRQAAGLLGITLGDLSILVCVFHLGTCV